MAKGEDKAVSGSEAPQERAQAKETTYVVMVEVGDPGSGTWRDLTAVTVPAKSKRRTIVANALEEAGAYKQRESGRLRVLDEKSAHVTTVEWEQPPPQLRIG